MKILDKSFTFEVPIKTVSEANRTEHWYEAYKRHRVHQKAVCLVFHESKPDNLELDSEFEVTLTRMSPRKLDGDNLQSSLKYVRDEVADCLLPSKIKFYMKDGKKIMLKGWADASDDIKWHYHQEKSKKYSVKIEILFA